MMRSFLAIALLVLGLLNQSLADDCQYPVFKGISSARLVPEGKAVTARWRVRNGNKTEVVSNLVFRATFPEGITVGSVASDQPPTIDILADGTTELEVDIPTLVWKGSQRVVVTWTLDDACTTGLDFTLNGFLYQRINGVLTCPRAADPIVVS